MLYSAAVAALPAWDDDAIMRCDLARLQAAIAAANERWSLEWRMRHRIAGHDVPEPQPPQSDEELNAAARDFVATLKARAKRAA